MSKKAEKKKTASEPTFLSEEFLINPLCEELVNNGTTVEVLTGQPNYPSGKIFSGYKATSISSELLNERIQIYRVPLITRGNGVLYVFS